MSKIDIKVQNIPPLFQNPGENTAWTLYRPIVELFSTEMYGAYKHQAGHNKYSQCHSYIHAIHTSAYSKVVCCAQNKISHTLHQLSISLSFCRRKILWPLEGLFALDIYIEDSQTLLLDVFVHAVPYYQIALHSTLSIELIHLIVSVCRLEMFFLQWSCKRALQRLL